MNLLRVIKIVLASATLVHGGYAAASGCQRPTPLPLSLVHQQGEFMLHYALDGQNALGDTDDFNRNGVPDLVEDAGLQLQVMRDLLMHFGFTNPLELGRYASQGVKVVHVRFLDINGNGVAMDEPRTPKGQPCGLLIDLSSKLKRGNLSPAHEYFHLVQYAYAPYKRGWYLEGMARWSETLLGADVAFNRPSKAGGKATPDEIFEMRYDAYPNFWQGFARESAEPHEHVLPDRLSSARYSRGELILKDNKAYGVQRMKAVLLALHEQGAKDSARLALDPALWPEKFQRDPEHDATLWAVLQAF